MVKLAEPCSRMPGRIKVKTLGKKLRETPARGLAGARKCASASANSNKKVSPTWNGAARRTIQPSAGNLRPCQPGTGSSCRVEFRCGCPDITDGAHELLSREGEAEIKNGRLHPDGLGAYPRHRPDSCSTLFAKTLEAWVSPLNCATGLEAASRSATTKVHGFDSIVYAGEEPRGGSLEATTSTLACIPGRSWRTIGRGDSVRSCRHSPTRADGDDRCSTNGVPLWKTAYQGVNCSPLRPERRAYSWVALRRCAITATSAGDIDEALPGDLALTSEEESPSSAFRAGPGPVISPGSDLVVALMPGTTRGTATCLASEIERLRASNDQPGNGNEAMGHS